MSIGFCAGRRFGARSRRVAVLLASVSAAALVYNAPARATDFPVTDAASLASAIGSAVIGDTITLQNDVSLGTTLLPPVAANVTIDGQNHAIDAQGKNRIFFLNSSATIENVTLKNGAATGGAGGAGGGGGMGAGGAIFVNTGTATISNVTFSGDSASGGAGGAAGAHESGGGGGGLGGGGGNPDQGGGAGGGWLQRRRRRWRRWSRAAAAVGVPGPAAPEAVVALQEPSGLLELTAGQEVLLASKLGAAGAAAAVVLARAATAAISPAAAAVAVVSLPVPAEQVDPTPPGGNAAGAGGGGGGGSADNVGGGSGNDFGGGGGGGLVPVLAVLADLAAAAAAEPMTTRGAVVLALVGGYGGGGGGGGAGTAYGGTAGSGGVGAGAGQNGTTAGGGNNDGEGGGGAAFGGAVFVRQGATLKIGDGSFDGSNGVTAGTGANNGAAAGTGLFLMSGTTTTFNPIGTLTIAGTIADDSAASLPSGNGYTAGSGAGAAIDKTGTGTLALSGANTYSGGTALNGGTLKISNGSALGTGNVALNGGTTGVIVDLDGNMSVANNFVVSGDPTYNVLTNDTTTISGQIGGLGDVVVNNGGAGYLGTLTLTGANTYSGGTTLDGGALIVSNSSALGTGAVTLNGGTAGVTVYFNKNMTVANDFTVSGDPTFNVLTGDTTTISGQISGSGDVVVNNGGVFTTGTLVLSNASNDYTGPTTVDGGTLKAGAANVFGSNSAMTVASGAALDLGGFNESIGSLAGAGTVASSVAGSATLTTGGDNSSTTFSGAIQNGFGTVALTKTGSGSFTLSGTDAYTGATTIDGGTLNVNGSIASSSGVIVNSGGTLGGTGIVPTTTVNSGGTLAPGNSIGTLTVAGDLNLNSGSTYAVQVSPSQADKTVVTGTANLAGTVNAAFNSGTYLSKSYTILHADTGLNGTFSTLTNTGLPAGFSDSVSYDTVNNNVLLTLTAQLGASGASGNNFTGNEQSVSDALNSYFNNGGTLPPGFVTLFGLTGDALASGLDQVSGESGGDVTQAGFDAANQFMQALFGSFGGGDKFGGSETASAQGDSALAYASPGTRTSAKAAEAYAAVTPGDLGGARDPARWGVWASGYGGTSSVSGDATVGSHDTTSSVYGTAVGATYRPDPDTTLGFALGGAGFNFDVTQSLGSGSAQVLQTGLYGRHWFGNAYLAGAAAFGWQRVQTKRTVTIAGTDNLEANFDAYTWSARLEGGYRFAMPWLDGDALRRPAADQRPSAELQRKRHLRQQSVRAFLFLADRHQLAYGAGRRAQSFFRDEQRHAQSERPRRLGA